MALLTAFNWFSSPNSQSLPHRKTSKTKQKYQHDQAGETTPVCLGYFPIIMTKHHDQNNCKLKHLTWESLFKSVRVYYHYIEDHGSRQAWSCYVLNPQEQGAQTMRCQRGEPQMRNKEDSWEWKIDDDYAEWLPKISKELNQTVRQREHQDTSDTAALNLITTVLKGRKLGSQKPNLQLFQGPGSSPKLDLTKSAPWQGHRTSVSFVLSSGPLRKP